MCATFALWMFMHSEKPCLSDLPYTIATACIYRFILAIVNPALLVFLVYFSWISSQSSRILKLEEEPLGMDPL